MKFHLYDGLFIDKLHDSKYVSILNSFLGSYRASSLFKIIIKE